ncbi:hypothetical protein C7974DRAFT_410274 [Boeremia exigua]|uniref:uncharacterized protein n=1 Tax=Boeremia exigua TaxID=749465 RepID=UPI001E8E8811|nr:uncharacterized protein C7974DRAFT_410274 [Boeremia exigua]KAH6639296.1 hypothetical protein C7974DRAFT_410274 [Boeremia exigua]
MASLERTEAILKNGKVGVTLAEAEDGSESTRKAIESWHVVHLGWKHCNGCATRGCYSVGRADDWTQLRGLPAVQAQELSDQRPATRGQRRPRHHDAIDSARATTLPPPAAANASLGACLRHQSISSPRPLPNGRLVALDAAAHAHPVLRAERAASPPASAARPPPATMSAPSSAPPDAYALLEDSFTRPPKRPARPHDARRSDSFRQVLPAAAPLQLPSAQSDNETASVASSQQSTPLASPGPVPADLSGLPPTPPSVSRDGLAAMAPEPPNRNSMVGSIASQKSSLGTPVNARSPPTPDPSPPRTAGSNGTAKSHNLTVDRPPLFAYPSSRAESFTTAREDLSETSNSRSATPALDRLSTVQEDRGLGLAFEQDDADVTPTERSRLFYPSLAVEEPERDSAATVAGAHNDDDDDDDDFPVVDQLPNREWNTELMRNVTVRRKRKPDSSPPKVSDPVVTAAPGATSPTTSAQSRRSSGLRERVEASSNSPRSPSVENFAHSIGWPADAQPAPEHVHYDPKSKRMSTASVASTIVAAVVVASPPQRQRTLRHSGKNLALQRDSSSTLSRASGSHSNRNSMLFEDVPLHRLVHKKATLPDRNKRFSTDSETLGGALSTVSTAPRNASPFSVRSSRTIDSSVYTLAHQESVRMILQPAADILSKSNSQRQPDRTSRMRISSAPESAKQATIPAKPRDFVELSPPQSPQHTAVPTGRSPVMSPQLPYSVPTPVDNAHRRVVSDSSRPGDVDKPLPRNPLDLVIGSAQRKLSVYDDEGDDKAPPPALLDRVRLLVAEREAQDEVVPSPTINQSPASPERQKSISSPSQLSPPVRRGSRSSRGRSEERRRSSQSQDRTSPFQDAYLRRSLDRTSPEGSSRLSYDWQRRTPDDHRRISFDRSTGRTEEHANARHLYSQSTPFSQFSDTPIEVSEATAVSIYPHNNDSLLVVQQPSRVNSMMPEVQMTDGDYFDPQDHLELRQEVTRSPTPPFVDAIEGPSQEPAQPAAQPTLTVEPSTPPMQIDLFQPAGVDSPLKNPRSAPEPPKIMFIPPTPAEELDRHDLSPPGPPKHSDSHPQRRLSLVQRARRYSDNFISPFLARASSNRGRYYSESHARSQSSHRTPEVPTVSDEDGTLHPFWRPRGFWDGFEDSDSEDEDNVLPSGGDTSDVEDAEPEPYPRRRSTLRKKLTNGFQPGFLIGNSLGVERHGTNRRRHHVTLPPHFPSNPRTSPTSSPRILNQSPTQPLRPQSSGVRKSGSRSSLRSSASFEVVPRRQSWRNGKAIPGLKGYQVQYIGVSGIKDRLKERTAEKRRDKIRKSIGSRYYVEPNGPMSPH